jgi:hypothetical protein
MEMPERRRAMDKSHCQKLAVRFKGMADEGLTDVKFFLRNLDEAAEEQVCKEVNELYEAVDRGDCVPLDFKDGRRKE